MSFSQRAGFLAIVAALAPACVTTTPHSPLMDRTEWSASELEGPASPSTTTSGPGSNTGAVTDAPPTGCDAAVTDALRRLCVNGVLTGSAGSPAKIRVLRVTGLDDEGRALLREPIEGQVAAIAPPLLACAREALGPVSGTGRYRVSVARNGMGLAVALESPIPEREVFLETCILRVLSTVAYPEELRHATLDVTLELSLE